MVCLVHSFIHSIGLCGMRQFLAVLRSFFHSSLLYTLFHQLVFQPPDFQNSYIILLWEFYFPFSVHAQTSIIYLTLLNCINFCIGECSIHFLFHCLYTGPKILLYTFLSKMFICFLSLFVSIQFLMHMLAFCLVFCLNFSFLVLYIYIYIFILFFVA